MVCGQNVELKTSNSKLSTFHNVELKIVELSLRRILITLNSKMLNLRIRHLIEFHRVRRF